MKAKRLTTMVPTTPALVALRKPTSLQCLPMRQALSCIENMPSISVDGGALRGDSRAFSEQQLEVQLRVADVQALSPHPKGGSKGQNARRFGNPIGRDGQPLKCHICDSEIARIAAQELRVTFLVQYVLTTAKPQNAQAWRAEDSEFP